MVRVAFLLEELPMRLVRLFVPTRKPHVRVEAVETAVGEDAEDAIDRMTMTGRTGAEARATAVKKKTEPSCWSCWGLGERPAARARRAAASGARATPQSPRLYSLHDTPRRLRRGRYLPTGGHRGGIQLQVPASTSPLTAHVALRASLRAPPESGTPHSGSSAERAETDINLANYMPRQLIA